jgi:hypothetical protein
VRVAAEGAALELPHHRETFASRGRGLKVLGENEKALQEPGLAVEPIVGQHRRGVDAGGEEACAETGAPREKRAS